MKSVIMTALVAIAQGWLIDLRETEEPESNLFLAPGDEVEIIVGGSAGTGGQWMYGFSNLFIFGLVD